MEKEDSLAITITQKPHEPDKRRIRMEHWSKGRMKNVYENSYPVNDSVEKADSLALRRFAQLARGLDNE